MNKTKLILPISILLTSFILGGFVYVIQLNKQESLEKQQQMIIDEQRRAEKMELEKENEIKKTKENCRNEASERARSFLKTKSEMTGGERLKEAVKKGLYLKEDYNSYYNECLALNGVEIENTQINNPQTKEKIIKQSPSSITNSEIDNLIKQQEEECQRDIAEYNSCLAEYNTEMAEYNSCLNGGSFSSFCSKPFNFCRKPICSY